MKALNTLSKLLCISISLIISMVLSLKMNKIILNFELSDLGVILDDFLEDNGLCCYIMDGPMVQYPPSLELFIYNVYYI